MKSYPYFRYFLALLGMLVLAVACNGDGSSPSVAGLDTGKNSLQPLDTSPGNSSTN